MARRMLIDATHPDESRVAIVEDSILDDYDAESSTKKQFKGNVYLAKVIRVEPSLQAAFVEYGHNRHGFLPFSEIHPDYYRIPVGDRPAENFAQTSAPSEGSETLFSDSSDALSPSPESSADLSISETPILSPSEDAPGEIVEAPISELAVDEQVELGDDEESVVRRNRPYRYKIQEVIKRRQILLIQVVKEERGNKGAALTTYLSLPGRYCVLMPNAGHRSGGISRKIADTTDRKRLRDILNDLPIPEGISLIVRTAGQDRNKIEIRRDFEYLIRLWSEIREKTLTSIAPALVYAEGDLIKRSIRDNYDKEVTEIIVEGEEGYKAAKTFMKTLIPSHAKRVKFYKEQTPLFQHYNVESQIDAIMSPVAILPSGGSIVINPTEALVAIDVNSGKSTRERHIDETAVKTNLEAAVEVARQMRLRDLAGLIVVDFIDMSDPKHIASVEKKLRESVRQDRARIQVGKISNFGLLEMSRQRLRPSIIESNMRPCNQCHGTGMVRSVESMALLILRAIESAGLTGKSAEVVATVPSGVDLYLLNQKRTHIILLEKRYDMSVMVLRDDSLVPPEFRLDTIVERDNSLKDGVVIAPVLVADLKPAKVEQASADQEKEAKSVQQDDQPTEEGERHRSHLRQRRSPFQNRRRNRGESPRPEGQDHREGRTTTPLASEEKGIENTTRPSTESDKTTKNRPERNIPISDQQGTQGTEESQDTANDVSVSKDDARRGNRRRGNRLDKKNKDSRNKPTEAEASTSQAQVVVSQEPTSKDASSKSISSAEPLPNATSSAPPPSSGEKTGRNDRRRRRGSAGNRPKEDTASGSSTPKSSSSENKVSETKDSGESKGPQKETPKENRSRENQGSTGERTKSDKSRITPFLTPTPLIDATGLMYAEDKPDKKKKKGFWSRLLDT